VRGKTGTGEQGGERTKASRPLDTERLSELVGVSVMRGREKGAQSMRDCLIVQGWNRRCPLSRGVISLSGGTLALSPVPHASIGFKYTADTHLACPPTSLPHRARPSTTPSTVPRSQTSVAKGTDEMVLSPLQWPLLPCLAHSCRSG